MTRRVLSILWMVMIHQPREPIEMLMQLMVKPRVANVTARTDNPELVSTQVDMCGCWFFTMLGTSAMANTKFTIATTTSCQTIRFSSFDGYADSCEHA